MKYKLFHLHSLFAIVLSIVITIAFTNCSDDDQPVKEEMLKSNAQGLNISYWDNLEIQECNLWISSDIVKMFYQDTDEVPSYYLDVASYNQPYYIIENVDINQFVWNSFDCINGTIDDYPEVKSVIEFVNKNKFKYKYILDKKIDDGVILFNRTSEDNY